MQNLAIQFQSFMANLPAFATAIIVIVLVINAIMWFFLPFAIYGIQSKMKTSRKIQEKILKIMEGDG